MIQDKEENLLRNRIQELAIAADRRGIPYYTDFLNLNEQNILHSMERQLGTVNLYGNGGYELAERKMFCFLSQDAYCDVDFPIAVVQIQVKNVKYCDQLTHRDYLGAAINLGIDRSKLGDIIVDFPTAYLFCKHDIAEYIVSNLVIIKHTGVCCAIVQEGEYAISPKYEEIRKTVSSTRLDAMIAVAFQGSRSSLSGLITGEKVFVNGKMILLIAIW